MKIVGLTGAIGAGKSTVAKLLALRGARVINADNVARELMRPETRAWQAIVKNFGRTILRPDNTIDRRKLGKIVFNDPESLALLNKIMHPRIVRAIKYRLRLIQSLPDNVQVVVIDNPLLIEMGLHRQVNLLVIVTAEDPTRLERLMGLGLSRSEALARMRAQSQKEQYLPLADIIIQNNGTIDDLRANVTGFWQSLDCQGAD